MKKITLLTSSILLLVSLNLFGQGFYDTNTINTIEITFAESNWDQILDNYYSAGNDDRLIGTALVNGVQYDSVGVKYKGNSTYSANNAKNPLNIKLNHILDQDYDGYQTLKLSSGAKDPSFVREVLSYEISRKYMDASQANFIKVYINGNYHGLYTSVESVNGDFQDGYLNADKDNTRIKCNPVSVFNGGSSLEYLGTDSTSYYDYYEMASEYGWQDLIDLTYTINNDPTNIENFLDIDRTIWKLAFNNVFVNLDSYTGPFKQNYYLIKNDNGILVPVIWDFNESFGGFSMIGGTGGGGQTALMQLDPLLRQNESDWPLLNLLLGDPTYKNMYIAHCRTMLQENVSSGWYSAKADSLQDLIAVDYQADQNKFYTYSQMLTNLNSSVSGGGGGPGGSTVGITQLMEARRTYLETHAEYTYTPPTISNIQVSNTSSLATFNVTITNGTTAFLGYKLSKKDEFTKVEMFDDGNHNDGAAGDGVFGIEVPVQVGKVKYYFYSENTNAGMFSPERAQHEFYELPVNSDVVINEFMASNDTTVADQDGEFDDWIELYNTSNSPISLNGFFLTDDNNDLTQWAFPDTTIGANDFLIVWADNDSGQVGLHANFKLSAGGEDIFLVDADTNIVDEVDFGNQNNDESYGRFPDGTGDFGIMTNPTFAAPNSNLTSIFEGEEITPRSFSLEQNFPNPFNPTTTINYELEITNYEFARLSIFNVLGQKVKEFELTEPKGSVVWNGTDSFGKQVSSGVYFYRLESANQVQTRRMILLK
ncbi:MAG: T9SS C-terminal target domain-containing protein [Calditrichaeota bacterium]|nr:MAG: T9SS C-terminal target domain-containing protein [Calditrichota bacterium]